MGGKLDIEVVSDPRRCREFIDMPWLVNAGDDDWAPPLRMAVDKLLNRSKYPFFNHGDAAFFLARRGREPVGRIAAIDNKLHAKTYNDGVGFSASSNAKTTRKLAAACFPAPRPGCATGATVACAGRSITASTTKTPACCSRATTACR
ncbi:MAG: hypothetical protein M5U25_07870 [Planctomycetota bacterium]|nr:hypothetical protein [Planctomycetota bacterium]